MLKPLHDSVVLKKEKVEQVTKSGIILSGDTKESPDYAEVVAVGEGRKKDGVLFKPVVKIGDKVIFKKYSITDVKYEDEDYMIIAEKDILAIIE